MHSDTMHNDTMHTVTHCTQWHTAHSDTLHTVTHCIQWHTAHSDTLYTVTHRTQWHTAHSDTMHSDTMHTVTLHTVTHCKQWRCTLTQRTQWHNAHCDTMHTVTQCTQWHNAQWHIAVIQCTQVGTGKKADTRPQRQATCLQYSGGRQGIAHQADDWRTRRSRRDGRREGRSSWACPTGRSCTPGCEASRPPPPSHSAHRHLETSSWGLASLV